MVLRRNWATLPLRVTRSHAQSVLADQVPQRTLRQKPVGLLLVIPSVWTFVLLALAAYRTWKLLAEDTILDKPRALLVRREWVRELILCPWCLGAWVSVAWWGAWWAWPHTTLIISVPFALSAVVGALALAVMALARD